MEKGLPWEEKPIKKITEAITDKIPTKEEFLKDIETNVPDLKYVREIELNKHAFKIYDESKAGKLFHFVYLILGLASMFIYWKRLDINILLSIILGVITYFFIRSVFDALLVRALGIDQWVKKASEKDIEESLEGLRKHGLIK